MLWGRIREKESTEGEQPKCVFVFLSGARFLSWLICWDSINKKGSEGLLKSLTVSLFLKKTKEGWKTITEKDAWGRLERRVKEEWW